jgi:hypothetical protein
MCFSSPELPLKPFAIRIGHAIDVENAEDQCASIFYHSSGQKEVRARAIAPEYLIALHSASAVHDNQVWPTKHLRHVLILVPVAVGRVGKFDFVVSEPHRSQLYYG